MLKKILLINSLLLLSACHSLSIHLTTQGIEPERVEEIKASLATIADDVIITELTIPKEFPNTVIASNPGYFNYSAVAALQDMLWSHDFGFATELRFAQGNHFYNDHHIGLYLRHPSLQSVPLLPPYLRTQYCSHADATIMFNKNGSYRLEYENKEDVTGELLIQSGRYLFDGEKIRLVGKEGVKEQEFTLSKQVKETQWGPKPADVFLPAEETDFAPLNCEFLIIYIQEDI